MRSVWSSRSRFNEIGLIVGVNDTGTKGGSGGVLPPFFEIDDDDDAPPFGVDVVTVAGANAGGDSGAIFGNVSGIWM